MSQLVRLEGKHSSQNAHCALVLITSIFFISTDKQTQKNKLVSIAPMHNVHFGYYVYLPTEQAETYLKSCVLINYSTYICLCLFGWKENILPKVHIVHCTPQQFPLKVITLWNPVDEKVVPMAERWYRKIYSFCKGFKVRFLCERKLIFQFFYSF